MPDRRVGLFCSGAVRILCVGDAGTGAAVGAAAGGMAGGMRSRRQMQAAEQQAEQAKQESNTNLAAWERFYITCMEGRGYGVK